MKIEIEPAPNGYVIRGDEGEILELVANDDAAKATREMLSLGNEHVGHPGNRHDQHRIRIITPPGDHWLTAKRDTYKHPWAEVTDFGLEQRWWCSAAPSSHSGLPAARSRTSSSEKLAVSARVETKTFRTSHDPGLARANRRRLPSARGRD